MGDDLDKQEANAHEYRAKEHPHSDLLQGRSITKRVYDAFVCKDW